MRRTLDQRMPAAPAATNARASACGVAASAATTAGMAGPSRLPSASAQGREIASMDPPAG